MEKVFTVTETAEYLQVSKESVRRYIRAKKLKAAKFGNTYRISENDIQTFLESMKDSDPKQ